MDTKTHILEHERLKNRLDVFSDVESIKLLEDIYIPKIANFGLQIDAMEASNKQIRECVVEFDERLSMKLNRSALTALANDLRREFLPITDGNKYLSTIESLRNEIKIWDGKFD